MLRKKGLSRESTEEQANDELATSAAKEALSAMQDEHFNTVFDAYKAFVKDNKKRPYVLRGKNADQDAMEFAQHLMEVFGSSEGVDDHPLSAHIETLDDELKMALYVFLGKKKKEEEEPKTGDRNKGKRSKKNAVDLKAATEDDQDVGAGEGSEEADSISPGEGRKRVHKEPGGESRKEKRKKIDVEPAEDEDGQNHNSNLGEG